MLRSRASSTRYGGALLIRGPHQTLCAFMGPGSAVRRDRAMRHIAGRTPYRVRDTMPFSDVFPACQNADV